MPEPTRTTARTTTGKSGLRRLIATRLAQSALVVVLAMTVLGAGGPQSSSEARFNRVGHELMCPCGCSQVLLECNHVGCPDSPTAIAMLHQQMDSGASDTAILQAFAQQYGNVILAAPLRGGIFDALAWIMPFACLLLGALAIVFLLRYWKQRGRPASPVPESGPAADRMRDRIRDETEY